MSNKIIVNATVTPPTYFIKSSKQYTSLTQRRLSKEIPNFQDMEVLAQKRHLRKWLNKEAGVRTRNRLLCHPWSYTQYPPKGYSAL